MRADYVVGIVRIRECLQSRLVVKTSYLRRKTYHNSSHSLLRTINPSLTNEDTKTQENPVTGLHHTTG